LNYLVGDQVYTVSHFDQPYYVLGYLARDGRVYVCDKDVAVTSFALSVSVIEYQTLVLRGDLEAATEMLAQGEIPEDQKNKIARFLEGQGYKEQALEVATDSEHRFELALGLGELKIALELAREADVEHKWKTVGDAALTSWDLALAEECFRNGKDLGSLMLLYTSSCNDEGLRYLAEKAQETGQHNVAFTCLWQTGDVDGCLDILLKTGRTAEAVFFAQSYKPSRCTEIVKLWKQSLEKSGKSKVSRLLGVPGEDEEMFPEWEEYLRLESEGGAQGDLIDVNGASDEPQAAEAPAEQEDEVVAEGDDAAAEDAEEPEAEVEKDT
jgi:coatomer subunit beta'